MENIATENEIGNEAVDGRLRVLITTDEFAVNSRTAKALAKDTAIYQRAGMLVHIVHESKRDDGITRSAGAPTIAALPEAVLRERLTRCVRFVQRKVGDNVIESPAHPPGWCVKAIAQRGSWENIRNLTAVVPSPVLRPRRIFLHRVGYDPKTGLYCADDAGVTVPHNPTKDNALQAVGVLLDVVCDFPFAKPEHRSAWLAFVLTPLSRHAFTGRLLYLMDANVRACGKTLLCELGSIIAYGRASPRMSNPGTTTSPETDHRSCPRG